MASTHRRYSKEEFARRGDAIYEKDIRPNLKAEEDGKFIAIDIETGAYELGTDELEACDRLRARLPGAQVWLKQVGSPYLHRFGGRGPRGRPRIYSPCPGTTPSPRPCRTATRQ
jgi:hypothetical protein